MDRAERAVDGGSGGVAWRQPRGETAGLQRYIQVLRERRLMILLTVAATTLMAVLYLAVADKVYEADADLLVTPAASDNQALTGLGLIQESNDPIRDVETAARLVLSRDVAAQVRDDLNLKQTPSELLDQVSAEPVAQSNFVEITAEADTPELARDLANGFADAVVATRSADLRRQLDQRIPRLRERIRGGEGAGDTGPDSLRSELAQLEALRDTGDPTLRVETRAEVPSSPASPRPKLTIIAAIFGGLILGVGGAFALHAMDPVLRREEQLRELYSLPILARIPKERKAQTSSHGTRSFFGIGPRHKRRRALAPSQLSRTTNESFRTLRMMLQAGRGGRGGSRSVLVTGPSPSEGKTTTAINLASSFALAGNRVILIEADFRRPTVGEALRVRPEVGIGRVLLGTASLEEALVPAQPFGDDLRLLLVDRVDEWLAEILSLPNARALLAEAERLADYVVIDSPPLTEVIDALPLAQQVDDVVIVTRLGASNLNRLARLGDLLEQNDIQPRGFVVVGVGSSDEKSYYLSDREGRTANDWLALEEDAPKPVRSAER
jgi:capsular exopolysaccharide synthesis family protein